MSVSAFVLAIVWYKGVGGFIHRNKCSYSAVNTIPQYPAAAGDYYFFGRVNCDVYRVDSRIYIH